MEIERFKNQLMRLVGTTEGEEPFHALRMMTNGLSSPKAAKIINYAVKCLNTLKEAYVEIGTWTGFSLVSAGYQNNAVCVGIDDLSLKDFYHPDIVEKERDKIRERIKKNMDLILNKHLFFAEKDFRAIEKLEFGNKDLKIGVFYIDGFHNFEQTMAAFEWGEPQLADEAIIILDDLHMQSVYSATMEQVFRKKYSILLLAVHNHLDLDTTLDEYISTGLAVLHFKRNK